MCTLSGSPPPSVSRARTRSFPLAYCAPPTITPLAHHLPVVALCSDPLSPVSRAKNLASTTPKTLALDDAREEILEFRCSRQDACSRPSLGKALTRDACRVSGSRSTLTETWNTSADTPGWMKPQEGAASPDHTKRFIETGLAAPDRGKIPSWLPLERTPDDPRILMTRVSPKTRAMGNMDSENFFPFPARPPKMKFRIDHWGMWPIKRDATTSVQEDQWLSLKTAFFDAAPDGRVTPVQIQIIVKRLFGTLTPQQLAGMFVHLYFYF